MKLIQEGLEDYDAIDSSLVHFHKVGKFLTISVERMELARPLRNRALVNIDEIKVKINNFIHKIGYDFVERLARRFAMFLLPMMCSIPIMIKENPCYVVKNNFEY